MYECQPFLQVGLYLESVGGAVPENDVIFTLSGVNDIIRILFADDPEEAAVVGIQAAVVGRPYYVRICHVRSCIVTPFLLCRSLYAISINSIESIR